MFFFIQSELVSQTGIVLETNIDGLLSSVAIHFWENPQGFKKWVLWPQGGRA